MDKCVIHSHEITYNNQIHRDRKQNDGCQGLEGGSNDNFLSNAYRVLVWDDKKVLEIDSDDGHTTMRMSKRDMYHNIHCSTIYGGQDMETT